MSTIHIPILTQPLLEALTEPFLRLPPDAGSHWFVDCTLGGGGHTSAFLEAFAKDPKLHRHRVLSVDQDLGAIERAKTRFKSEIDAGRLELIHQKFGDIESVLADRPILGLMADLGFSSDQLEDSSRGMSFQKDAPLDMRLDPSSGVSCADFLNQATEDELEKIIGEFGEERFSRRIASAIVYQRQQGRALRTTKDLVDVVVHAIPPRFRHGRIHVATKTFQALRIAVNQELEQLDKLLNHVIVKVRPGGRIGILSFHSLEDRKVKHCFKKHDLFRSVWKKPLQADEKEVQFNPRARSAKLRVAERIGAEGEG